MKGLSTDLRLIRHGMPPRLEGSILRYFEPKRGDMRRWKVNVRVGGEGGGVPWI